MRRADPWPLNADGELMLGLKIEDRHCLPDADAIAGTPGIAFAEWGPGDMGLSFGDPDLHDPPYTPQMDEARNIVKSACDKAGIAFLCSWGGPIHVGRGAGPLRHRGDRGQDRRRSAARDRRRPPQDHQADDGGIGEVGSRR